jgi:hypothetical protein
MGGLLLLALVLFAFGAGQSARGAQARPMRLGIFHPYPRLCVGQERGQKERRVLRLAYWIARPGARNRLPWFYRLERATPAAAQTHALTLATTALWGFPPTLITAGHPDFFLHAPGEGLVPWGQAMRAAVPGLEPAVPPSPLRFGLAAGAATPFLFSRLQSTGLLPSTSALAGNVDTGCRDWPAGVSYRRERGVLRYRLSREPGGHGPPFTLAGYRTLKGLLADLRRGRLDAVLLEGDAFAAATARPNRLAGGVLAAYSGTQQVLLRFSPRLRAALGPEGLALLSMAVGRRALAEAAGPGFAPARAFLEPVMPGPPPAGGEALRWNSLEARRRWLNKERPAVPLRLGVLPHPTLERAARGIAGQWKRTLNLSVTVEPLPVDRFQLAQARGDVDLVLDVADLDDGSLQELWHDAPPDAGANGAPPPDAQTLAVWESRLQATLPYLPLLINLHHLLSPGPGAFRRVAALCKACEPSTYARFLRGK